MPKSPLMTVQQFAEWWSFLSESDEEKLRSGERLVVEGRVHYKGYWKENPAVGVSVMLASDIKKLNPLAQTVDGELVVHLFDVVRSDIPTLFAVNINGFENVPMEKFNKIEVGDSVKALVSIRVNDGKTWLNGTGIKQTESGDLDAFRFENAESSKIPEPESSSSRHPLQENSKPRGTDFQQQHSLNEARSMGLDDIANSEEQMRDMYWNIN